MPAPDQSKQEVIDQILRTLSTPEQLNEIPEDLITEFDSNPLGLEPSQNELLIKHFKNAFMEDSLLSIFKKEFSDRYKDSMVDSIQHWVRKGPVQTGLEAKKEFYTLQGTRKRVVRMYELEQNSPSEKRIELIRSLKETTSAVETVVESQAVMFRSVIKAFSTLSEQNFTDSQLDNFVANYKIQIKPQASNEITNQLMITYYNLDDETLRKFVNFHNTKEGKWLNDQLSDAITETYRKAAERFINSVKNTDSL